MLEYWFKEKRTMVDFRRGPIGPYFDRFAAHLKDRGYSADSAKEILGKCCQFNAFLIEKRIAHCRQITETLVDNQLEKPQFNTCVIVRMALRFEKCF